MILSVKRFFRIKLRFKIWRVNSKAALNHEQQRVLEERRQFYCFFRHIGDDFILLNYFLYRELMILLFFSFFALSFSRCTIKFSKRWAMWPRTMDNNYLSKHVRAGTLPRSKNFFRPALQMVCIGGAPSAVCVTM